MSMSTCLRFVTRTSYAISRSCHGHGKTIRSTASCSTTRSSTWGRIRRVFLGMMKELYRICRDGAEIEINVPHPRHDNFIGDPTHVRIITPDTLLIVRPRGE